MWWTAGEDVDFLIEYIVDGDFVIPDSAVATVRDNSGSLIAGLSNVPLAVDTTSATVNIPAAANTVASGAIYELRHVSVSFVKDGRTHHRTFHYKVAPFLPITASPGEARRELGLGSSEAPDADFDILSAYVLLRVEYGQEIEDALTAGGDKTIAVNKAIAIKAALDLVNGLVFRAAVKLKAEDSAFERMSEFDVTEVRIRLGQRLSKFLNIVSGDTSEGSPSLVLATPTDAITGE